MVRPSRVLNSLAAVMLAVVGLPPTAGATAVAYFGGPDESKLSLNLASAARTPFLSALGSHGVENVESSSGANPMLTFAGSNITAASGFSNGVNSQYAYSVSGVKFLWDTEGENDWLLFSEPITAFGSYLVQAGDGASAAPTLTPTNLLTLHLENTLLGTGKDVPIAALGPDWPFYNVTFIGVTDSEPFNRVSFVESYDHDGLLFDDLIAGFLAPPPFPGDADGSRTVDFSDLGILLNNYNQPGAFSTGDFDNSGVADFADLGILLNNYNQTAPALAVAAPVPEPGTLLLACMGTLALVFLGRRVQ